MATLSVFFVILHLGSVLFTLFIISRLYRYIRRYRFDESQYTLLFGFVHLHWITYLYVFFTIIWIYVSYYFLTLVPNG